MQTRVLSSLQLMMKGAQMNHRFPADCQSFVAGNAVLYASICTITLTSRKLIALRGWHYMPMHSENLTWPNE
jgi:hypothetical protein